MQYFLFWTLNQKIIRGKKYDIQLASFIDTFCSVCTYEIFLLDCEPLLFYANTRLHVLAKRELHFGTCPSSEFAKTWLGNFKTLVAAGYLAPRDKVRKFDANIKSEIFTVIRSLDIRFASTQRILTIFFWNIELRV